MDLRFKSRVISTESVTRCCQTMAALLRDQETVATPSLPIFLALTHSAIITQLDKLTPVAQALAIHV